MCENKHLFIVEDEGLHSVIKLWESMSLQDQLNWSGESARTSIREAILPLLEKHGIARIKLLKSPESYPTQALQHLVIALSQQLGFIVPQSYDNNITTLIRNEGLNYRSHQTRGHQTNSELSFHSDRCDLTILLYVRLAPDGGKLSVVSYKEAAEQLAQENETAFLQLFEEFPFDLREERIFASPRWNLRPVLWNIGQGLSGHYIRRFIMDSSRYPDCPQLSKTQLDALDSLDSTLDKLREPRSFYPISGELLILDNYHVMHARSEFTDTEIEGRLGIRVWVAPFHSKLLPQFLFPISGALTPGCFRGGIGQGKEYHNRLGELPLKESYGSPKTWKNQ